MQLIGLGYPIEEILRITGVREVDIREMKKNRKYRKIYNYMCKKRSL